MIQTKRTYDWSYCGHVGEWEKSILNRILPGEFESEIDAWDALYAEAELEDEKAARNAFDAVSLEVIE